MDTELQATPPINDVTAPTPGEGNKMFKKNSKELF